MLGGYRIDISCTRSTWFILFYFFKSILRVDWKVLTEQRPRGRFPAQYFSIRLFLLCLLIRTAPRSCARVHIWSGGAGTEGTQGRAAAPLGPEQVGTRPRPRRQVQLWLLLLPSDHTRAPPTVGIVARNTRFGPCWGRSGDANDQSVVFTNPYELSRPRPAAPVHASVRVDFI